MLLLFFFFYFPAVPHAMKYLSSLTRDRTCAPAVGAQRLRHGTSRKSLGLLLNLTWCFLRFLYSVLSTRLPKKETGLLRLTH